MTVLELNSFEKQLGVANTVLIITNKSKSSRTFEVVTPNTFLTQHLLNDHSRPDHGIQEVFCHTALEMQKGCCLILS